MDTEDRFEELKVKFGPALEFLEHSRISVQALNVQDNRLLVRVVVPTEELRDRVIERFRRLNPALDEVHLDVRIEARDNVDSTGQSSVQSDGEISRG